MVDLVLEIIHIIHGIIHMFLSALLFVFSSHLHILKKTFSNDSENILYFSSLEKTLQTGALKYPETNTIT